MSTSRFLGEFEISMDAKQRVMMPAALKRQLPSDAQEKLVINRGIEHCLVLYPMNEWNLIVEEVNKLNPYVKKNRDFIRYFFRGATEIGVDTVGRFLLPKSLLSYASIEKDVVMLAYLNKIEIWSQKLYDNLIIEEPSDFSQLAEEVMGKIYKGGDLS